MTAPQIDVDSLPPTQNLMLELLAARYRLGHTYWAFPKDQRRIAEQLAKLGLVWWRSGPAPKVIEVRFTDAGEKLMLSHAYTPPILAQPRPSVLDLRALAVIFHAGRQAADNLQDAGLSSALEWMTETAVTLHDPTITSGDTLEQQFAELAARYR